MLKVKRVERRPQPEDEADSDLAAQVMIFFIIILLIMMTMIATMMTMIATMMMRIMPKGGGQ